MVMEAVEAPPLPLEIHRRLKCSPCAVCDPARETCILGRTVPSFRMVLEAEIANWRRFLKALPSKADKEAFEELMNHCRRHAGAAGAAVRPIPLEAMIMSMLLAHEKMILEIEKSVRELTSAKNWETPLSFTYSYKQRRNILRCPGSPTCQNPSHLPSSLGFPGSFVLARNDVDSYVLELGDPIPHR